MSIASAAQFAKNAAELCQPVSGFFAGLPDGFGPTDLKRAISEALMTQALPCFVLPSRPALHNCSTRETSMPSSSAASLDVNVFIVLPLL